MSFFGFLGRRRSQPDRMHEMIQRLGVDGVALAEAPAGANLATAARECQNCSSVGACERWLDGRSAGKDPYAFCPNGALFAEHRRS